MLGQVYPYRFYKWIQSFVENCMGNSTTQRGQEGAVVRAVASHQCGLGWNPDVDAICGLSLLLVLSFASRGFSADTLDTLLKNQHSQIPIRSGTHGRLLTISQESFKCFVGKQITTYNLWNPLVVVNIDQIHFFILACVMSCEFTRVMKKISASLTLFLSSICIFIGIFILLKCERFFSLFQYREVVDLHSLLIKHAGI